MKKKWCDNICLIFLVVGIIILPLCKGHFDISDQLMVVIVCGTTIFLSLLVKAIGYTTGYSTSERKEDYVNFGILLLLLIGLPVYGIIIVLH